MNDKPQRDQILRSALQTLEAEQAGLGVLAGALQNGLGEAFAAAVERMAAAQGRIIITGMGKSGHIARKLAATLTAARRRSSSTGGRPCLCIRPRPVTAISA